jgi:SPP1 family predicted phage head-tail adaptor
MINHLLKDTVTVYSVTEAESTATGEFVKTQSTGFTIKARISPLSARESYYAHKSNLDISHRMYCEYSTLFNQLDRVNFNSRTYEVKGITNPSEWNKFLQVDLLNVE